MRLTLSPLYAKGVPDHERKSCGEKSRDSFEKEEQANANHQDLILWLG